MVTFSGTNPIKGSLLGIHFWSDFIDSTPLNFLVGLDDEKPIGDHPP
jgi:hypothetical protein